MRMKAMTLRLWSMAFIAFVLVVPTSVFADLPPGWVNAADYGYNPIDATTALKTAISTGAVGVFVPYMGPDWIITPIRLHSNQEILFEEGVVVTAKEGEFLGTSDCLFWAWDASNIILTGYGATLRMRKNDYLSPPYPASEHRHVLRFYSCSNVTVRGLTLRDSGGDGIILAGGGSGEFCEDVVIQDVTCDNNYRQGCSVISVKNLLIEDSVFINTSGTQPESGIDIEPDDPCDILVNIEIRNSIFNDNLGCGIMFVGLSVGLTDTIIENCTMVGNAEYGLRIGVMSNNWTIKDSIIADNGQYGLISWPSVSADYTAFWNNVDGPVEDGASVGTGGLTDVEPKFASTDPNNDYFMYLAADCNTAITEGASDNGYMGARPLRESLFCGDLGTVYLQPDLNTDCYVDLLDLNILAGGWLKCTDPENSDCDKYWK